jgi:hypothetical protein
MSQPPPDNDNGDDDDTQRRNLAALAAVIALVALAVFLMVKLKAGIAMQDCFAQGRHDCAPIDTSKM